MPHRLIRGCVGGFVFGMTLLIQAAGVPEYRLKAELVERFTRFIEWPGLGADAKGPFQVCLLGSNPFGTNLAEVMAGRMIKNRTAAVSVVTDLAALDSCHAVFIPAEYATSLERILVRTAGRPILTIGDTPGFAERGVLINLYLEKDHVRFEINEGMVRKSGLGVSSRLFKLARVVAPEEHR